MQTDTIVAVATAPGKGGIGIVRVSGKLAQHVSRKLINKILVPRVATFCCFYNGQQQLDEGIALYFPAPHSYTGEDVLELQGHGGPFVLDQIISAVLTVEGVRLARPGEFSERAFLNGKLDLAQAEAVADLIDASSHQAARSALRSLQGVFSDQISQLVSELAQLRMYVEAAIDFPEEEADFLSDGAVSKKLAALASQVDRLKQKTQVGVLLKEGISVVIAGKPNAGKSSLLNALSGQDRAIVTDIAGTTRDILTEQIQIQGVPLHIIDTAGLRESDDVVEQAGIERAHQAIEKADHILWLVDVTLTPKLNDSVKQAIAAINTTVPVTVIFNKVDLVNQSVLLTQQDDIDCVYLSAKNRQGLTLLGDHLLKMAGISQATEGNFTARRRHIDAIMQAGQFIENGLVQLEAYRAGELLAEDLRQAQQVLSSITGQFTADDLLGEIFSQFCMGK